MFTKILQKCCYGVAAGLSLFFLLASHASHANVINVPVGGVRGITVWNYGTGGNGQTFNLDVDEPYVSHGVLVNTIGDPTPNLSVIARSLAPIDVGIETQNYVYAEMEYYWWVTGPKQLVGTPAVMVPLVFEGLYSGFVSGEGLKDSGRGTMSLYLGIQGSARASTPSEPHNVTITDEWCDGVVGWGTCTSSAHARSWVATVFSEANSFPINGYENRLTMQVGLDVRGIQCTPGMEAIGCVTYHTMGGFMGDPYIHVEDQWALSNPGYTVTVSAGFGNERPTVGQVPEPTTLTLLGLGFAGLSFSRRRVKVKKSYLTPVVIQRVSMHLHHRHAYLPRAALTLGAIF